MDERENATPDADRSDKNEGSSEPGGVVDSHQTYEPTADEQDELVDEMVAESFPGSDPPSTWAGSDTPSSEPSAAT